VSVCVKLGFLDAIDWNYVVDTAWKEPLGGTQSGVCYVAEALVRGGDEVCLLNSVDRRQESHGVACIPYREVFTTEGMASLHLDALVVVASARNGYAARQVVGPDVPVILWSGHAADQLAMESLGEAEFREAFDGFAMVSQWQRDRYVARFDVDRERTEVLRNSVAPAFEGAYGPQELILQSKQSPPVLAYTSTPFRGLDVLVELFPRIRREIPGVRLKVFSSMEVYKMDGSLDADQFGALYDACRSTEGIEYIGGVPQPQLAEALREVSILAYPNTFPETSCIAVMEAMASGCHVVTSELGALPETLAGFGVTVGLKKGADAYAKEFIDSMVDWLVEGDMKEERENRLRRQVDFVNEHYSWTVRAREWVDWVRRLRGDSS
jgi:glycosyltransferase involved in cell wall biosynthesis